MRLWVCLSLFTEMRYKAENNVFLAFFHILKLKHDDLSLFVIMFFGIIYKLSGGEYDAGSI